MKKKKPDWADKKAEQCFDPDGVLESGWSPKEQYRFVTTALRAAERRGFNRAVRALEEMPFSIWSGPEFARRLKANKQ